VRNSPLLPALSLMAGVFAMVAVFMADSGDVHPLSELQLGTMSGALALVIFGIQGLLSVGLEGRELRPGIAPPQLTTPLSAAIVIVSLLLFTDALLLGYGIVSGWGTPPLGIAAGAGCVFLAALLIFYKEAFLGDEARFDDREDGIPW
jgi:hypothetical protein